MSADLYYIEIALGDYIEFAVWQIYRAERARRIDNIQQEKPPEGGFSVV